MTRKRIGPPKKPGRPINLARKEWADRYQLTPSKAADLTTRKIEQLRACKSEEARRLLLGLSQ